MKAKKRFFSLLLASCLVVGLMPAVAFAANNGKAIQLGTGVLNAEINTANAATVYFGKDNADQPGAWRVIGYGGSGAVSAQGDMTLLAADCMGTVQFDADGSSNEYAASDLKPAIDELAGKLTAEENTAVNKRTLTSGSYVTGGNTDCIAGAQVDNAVFWPLSTAEGIQVDHLSLRVASSNWWLRSPGITGTKLLAW